VKHIPNATPHPLSRTTQPQHVSLRNPPEKSASRKPSQQEEARFKAMLDEEQPDVFDPLMQSAFMFWPEMTKPDTAEPEGSSVFMSVMPDIAEQLDGIKQLPADFSLLLPDQAEIAGRLTQDQDGVMNVVLGFNRETLNKLVGFEREGETLLQRRLGKRLRLKFKLRSAL